MVYALKSQRLITRKQPKDRVINCQIHPSSEEKEGYSGCLYTLIEIENNLLSSAQISHSIANTTAREYFRAKSDSAIEKFETALKKTNELLAQYTQEGQTEWIGNIHGAICLVYKNEIHLSTVGQVKTSIIREGKIAPIIDPSLINDEIHPLCTFCNITSGDLEKGDIVILASKDIFKDLSQKDIKQILEINTLEDSSVEIARQLSLANNFKTNCLLIEITTKDDIANEPLTNIPETIYIDELTESFLQKFKRSYIQHINPQTKEINKHLLNKSKDLKHWFKTSALPRSKQLAQKISAKSRYLSQKTKNSATKLYNQTTGQNLPVEPVEQYKPIKINHYRTFPRFKFPSISKYPLIIIILIIILGISIFIRFKPKPATQSSATNSNQSQLKDLKSQVRLAESANSQEAINILNNIITDLDKNNISNEEKEIKTTATQKYNSLTKTEAIAPLSSIKTNKNILKTIVSNQKIYAISKNKIFTSPISNPELKEITASPKLSSNILAAAGPDDQKNIFLLTEDLKLYLLNTADNKLILQETTANWKNTDQLDNLNKNLYQADPDTSQVWKYTFKNAKYSPAPYITKPTVNPWQSISVGNFIYGLYQNEIYKLSKSGPIKIAYKKFPSNLLLPKNSNKILVSGEEIFIVNQNKIIITDLSGNYKKQILSESPIKNITKDNQNLIITLDNKIVISSLSSH